MPLFVQAPHNPAIAGSTDEKRYINFLDRNATAVQRELKRGGLSNYLPETTATILSSLELSDSPVFYDIGAHVGFFSALASFIYKAQGIATFGFEPTPDTHKINRQVRSRNRLNYTIVPKAISDRVGDAQLFLSPKAETSNSLNQEFRQAVDSLEVQTDTLDNFTANGAPDPTVIKISAATFEAEIIRGAWKTIKRARPWIICEILPKNYKAISELVKLQNLGYIMYQISDARSWRMLQPDDVVRNKTAFRNYLLAPVLPSEVGFFDKLAQWKAALAACDATTNRFSDPDQPPSLDEEVSEKAVEGAGAD